MNWRHKAVIQRVLNRVPFGRNALYRLLQRHCGGLVKGYDYSFLLSETARMACMLRETGFDLDSTSVMEVGTGWRVDMPLGFYLCGAARVITCDLNRYLVEELALETVQYVVANAERVAAIFPFVDPAQLQSRIAALRGVSTLAELFRVTGIEYHAPCDCAATNFASGSVDLHYSYTVFEHIPPATLEAILREANRLLSPRGIALHHIDLGDHFAQVDPSITPANFLQFSPREWERYAGTPWSYHNRLREDDYRALFARVPQEIVAWRAHIDEPSLGALRGGLQLDPEFDGKSLEMLSVAIVDVLSRATRRAGDKTAR